MHIKWMHLGPLIPSRNFCIQIKKGTSLYIAVFPANVWQFPLTIPQSASKCCFAPSVPPFTLQQNLACSQKKWPVWQIPCYLFDLLQKKKKYCIIPLISRLTQWDLPCRKYPNSCRSNQMIEKSIIIKSFQLFFPFHFYLLISLPLWVRRPKSHIHIHPLRPEPHLRLCDLFFEVVRDDNGGWWPTRRTDLGNLLPEQWQG